MKFFRWQSGRCVATEDIKKFPIWSGFGFDIYLLKFFKGKLVSTHTDPVEGKNHHRFNLTLWGFWQLKLGKESQYQSAGDAHLFRPDIVPHSAKFLTDCMVLSIGWITKKKHEQPSVSDPDSSSRHSDLCLYDTSDKDKIRHPETTPGIDKSS